MLRKEEVLRPQAKVTGIREIEDVGLTGCWQGCWLSWKLAKGGEEEWTWWCCVLQKVSCRCVPDASESVITVANGATPAGRGREDGCTEAHHWAL